MATIYDPIRYGWGLIYALEVEGVPVYWTQATTGHAPAGYAESVCLVLDGSSAIGQTVDRDAGLGAGLPLTWRLLDTLADGTASAVASWLKRPTLTTSLTADVAGTDTQIPVTSTAGWPVPGALWLGVERIAYSAVTATTFGTGGSPATRGTAGSLPSVHKAATVGGLATNLPRWWRGRQVRLWAHPVTPTGYVLPDRAEVWRGHLSTGPDRSGAGWQFEALSLDRRLAEPVVPGLTGRIVDSLPRAAVEPTDYLTLDVRGYSGQGPAATQTWGYQITIYPYAGLASGTLLSPEQQQALIGSAWTAAVAVAKDTVGGGIGGGANLDGLQFLSDKAFKTFCRLALDTHAATKEVRIWRDVNGETFADAAVVVDGGTAGVGGVTPWLWGSREEILQVVATGEVLQPPTPVPSVLAVQLDGVNVLAPSAGVVSSADHSALFSGVSQSGSLAYLKGITELSAQPLGFQPGDEVTLGFTVAGKFEEIMLIVLESSGTALLRGNYDALSYGHGYSLDANDAAKSALDEQTFLKLTAPASTLKGGVVGDGKSFGDMFGGILAVSRLAVVARPDHSGLVRLGVVSTASPGSDYAAVITDADLLTRESEPVKTLRRRTVPNALTIEIHRGGADPVPVTVIDAPSVAEQGQQEVRYAIPVEHGQAVDPSAIVAWATSLLLASQTTQAIEIRVPPWVAVEVGDVVRLELEHWGVWSWQSGASGYTGPGRVIGKQLDLASKAVTLTVLIDAAPTSTLCPAAEVQAFAGLAAAPTSIDLEVRFLPHLERALELAGGPVRLLHYRPGYGAEASGGAYTYSAASDIGGGLCRITVASILGGATLGTASTLTLPELANADTYQALFAHVGDGTSWQ